MKKAVLLNLLLTISLIGFSQSCLPDGITFSKQEQVDNFQTNYPGCIEIEGDTRILSHIENLNGLVQINSIAGNVSIENNIYLKSLNGLNNLVSIGGDFELIESRYLESMAGFEKLAFVNGNIKIYNNRVLKSLVGFENLSSIQGDLSLRNNDSISYMSGLDSLNSIGGSLAIEYNLALESLMGMNNLTSIDGNLIISYNYSLSSLSGLGKIVSNSINNLTIEQNAVVSECEVKSICDYLAKPNGKVKILNNKIGCNSEEEVEKACGIFGVDELINSGNITIHPNPSTYSVTIEYELIQPGIVKVSFYDKFGRLVEVIEYQHITWSPSNLSPGMYFTNCRQCSKRC
jgi:hypothetical protein